MAEGATFEDDDLVRLLTRTLPEPARVEALALLEFSAYARGDGPLAGVALEEHSAWILPDSQSQLRYPHHSSARTWGDRRQSSDLPDSAKSLRLGLKITNMVSTEVRGAAKRSLGDSFLCSTAAGATARNGAPEHDERGELALALIDAGSESRFASQGMPHTPQTPGPSEWLRPTPSA